MSCGFGQPEALPDFPSTRPQSPRVSKCGEVRTLGFSRRRGRRRRGRRGRSSSNKERLRNVSGSYSSFVLKMIHAVIHLIHALGLFQKGLAAVIETQQTVMAAVGEEALLNCQLMQPKDVVQVTWQKILPDKEQNVATYNKYFGQKVNPDFRDKVEFKYAGLLNSSIVIKNVTEEDEGCYHCLFNTYPDGALTGSTCLHLYELHEPVLHVRESNSPEEAVVSCSATGRPAPTVTLTVPHYNSTSVTNTNATVTVTATAVLPRLHGNSTQVGCAVRVLSGPQIEVFTMIPEVTLSSADGVDEESGSDNSDLNVTLITVLVVVSCVCVAAAVIIIIIILPKRKHQNRLSHRDSEENRKQQRTIKDTEEDKTLVAMLNIQSDSQHPVRRRTVSDKDQTRDQSTPASSANVL